MPNDFLQDMPLSELVRVVKDLCRKFGVTEEEIERIGRMSPAERDQMLRDLEDKYRRWNDGGANSPGTNGHDDRRTP